MRYEKTHIPMFYDILEDEIVLTRMIYEKCLDTFKKSCFEEIMTCSIEEREPYLAATKVHWSKIFEVRRSKERSCYLLQSDLAMSMSRYVAQSQHASVVKLIQLGTLFRDRIDPNPDYRRGFQQILSGIWGIEHYCADVELLFLNYEALCAIKELKNIYLQISNHCIFEQIFVGLTEKIRFEGIQCLEITDISISDKKILYDLFKKGQVGLKFVKSAISKINDMNIKNEMQKAVDVGESIQRVADIPIVFNLANLGGSGHYSGMNYRFYASIDSWENQLIADGGRIDQLCEKFNKNSHVSAVCMGIGVQVIAQHLKSLERNRVILLVEPENDKYIEQAYCLCSKMQSWSDAGVICIKRKKWKKVFQSALYENVTFILLYEDGNIEIRADDINMKRKLSKYLEKENVCNETYRNNTNL